MALVPADSVHGEIVDGHGEKLVPRVAVVAQCGPVDVHERKAFKDPHGMAVFFEHAATIGLRVRPSSLDQLHLHHQSP